MSSSVGSAVIRSSCFWSRSSSPESLAPPSRLIDFSFERRSRSRSSASLAIGEEPQQAREVGLQLGPGNDRVDVAEAQVRLGAAEVVRELLARRLLHDARA